MVFSVDFGLRPHIACAPLVVYAGNLYMLSDMSHIYHVTILAEKLPQHCQVLATLSR